jgi:hypothetical protein
MTMHMVGPHLTTTNYKKRKKKPTKAQLALWQEEYREECRYNKRRGLPKITFEEFVDRIYGKKAPTKKTTPKTLQPAQFSPALERIEAAKQKYPSVENTAPAVCTRPERHQYSGERKLIGIATTHKSNAIPVWEKQEAIDIARMRR